MSSSVARPALIRSASLGLVVSLAAAGCTGGQDFQPVAGRVTLDGKPVPSGKVTFYPADGAPLSGRMIPHGEIGPDGQYQMRTDGRDGVPAGSYKVVLTTATTSKPTDGVSGPDRLGFYHLVPARYESFENTPLRLNVLPQGGTDYALTLTR